MEEHRKIQIFLCQRKQEVEISQTWIYQLQRADRDSAIEKNSLADRRTMQENEGAQGSSSTYTDRG
jgi:hypothetical protein